ncbi:MAG: hypothetical protein FWD78_15580 [Treponema sp.]|nr:hypothetical protein [Treponema sp.]
MKIIEIKNIVRKDVPIYYKRFYKGNLVLDIMDKQDEIPVEFSIEHKPTGHTEIEASFAKEINYPLVPLMKELKTFIADLESNRKLPS